MASVSDLRTRRQQQMQLKADAVLGNKTLPSDIEFLYEVSYIGAFEEESLRLKNEAPL